LNNKTFDVNEINPNKWKKGARGLPNKGWCFKKFDTTMVKKETRYSSCTFALNSSFVQGPNVKTSIYLA
jgi:hypothetical protein